MATAVTAKIEYPRIGDDVRITEGPYEGLAGKYVANKLTTRRTHVCVVLLDRGDEVYVNWAGQMTRIKRCRLCGSENRKLSTVGVCHDCLNDLR